MEAAILRGIESLSTVVSEFLSKDIELLRVCRTAIILKECNVNPFNLVFDELAQKCIRNQREDGGWTDVEETLWCTAFLDIYDDYSGSVNKAIKWLEEQENNDGCWGKSNRDHARIPLTSMLLYFLPHLRTDHRFKWLESNWQREQKMNPVLTYKVALPIMVFSRSNYKSKYHQLINNSINWLCDQQNDDGGWSPWKGHPMGSDPWSTGICLASIISYHSIVPSDVINNGLEWIVKKQLPDGMWPYHYIEDGSSWALYALIKGKKLTDDSRP